MTNELQQLKQLIIKNNPQELKNGDKVILDQKGYPEAIVKEKYFCSWRKKEIILFYGGYECPLEELEIKEIIDKPITLAQVLIAIQDKCMGILFDKYEPNLWWIEIEKSDPIPLEPKDLDEQSPETLSQLLKLLNNE